MNDGLDVLVKSDWQETPDNIMTDLPPHLPSKSETGFNAIKLHGGRQSRTLAPNLTRRSHKKSRAGCYTCKNRKIKCGEQKPQCGNCLLKGLSCLYPSESASRKSNALVVKRLPSISPSTVTFTMSDMRFFHHFLISAYPHLPLGNEQVWVHEVPQFAEQHEYLMHAMLSLGASHLSRLTGVDYRKEALVHRGHAIAGLNQALSQKAQSYGEPDAMLAACYALTFQSSYMGDGLSDFITMVRGCALTTAKIRTENSPTAFNLQPDHHFEIMAPRLANLPSVDLSLLDDAVQSLEDLQPLLDDEVNLKFWNALMDVVTSLQISSASGYAKFIEVYAVWYELGNDSFKNFLEPNNLAAQILLAYFIAIEMLMIPLSVYEWPNRADPTKVGTLRGIIEWAEDIFNKLNDYEFPQFLNWPKRVVSIASAEMAGISIEGPSILQLRLPVSQDCSPSPAISLYQFDEYDFPSK